MATVKIDVASRGARRIDGGDTTWVLYGDVVPAGDADRLGLTGDPASAADRFVSANRRSCIVYVTRDAAGGPVAAGIRRGIICQRDAFYRGDGDDLFIDDVFRNAVRRVPVAERTPGVDALVEHYLFRRVLPPLTYLPAVAAVPTATAVDFDLVSGTTSQRVVDRLDVTPERRSPAEYVSEVDAALSAAVDDLVTPGSALLFSGGVDSTLLLTYCKDLVTPMTLVPDSPEFAVETGYADEAARIAGVEYVPIPAREADYPDLMRRVVEQLAYPPIHDMIPFKPLTFPVTPEHEVMGLMSDSLFGLDSRAMRTALSLRSAWLRTPVAALLRLAVGPLRRRAGRLERRMMTLHADPYGLDGTPANAFVTGDLATMRRIAGDDEVDGARARLADRFLARYQLHGTEAWVANLEAAHMAIVVTGPGGHESLLSEEAGHDIRAPFEDVRVVEASLRVPPDERYLRDGVLKWLPKRLLAERLPGYPAYQEKKHTALPVDRYYRSGPLADFWERYDMPDLLDAEARRDVRGDFSMMTWNAMSHAMWLEHVGRRPDIPEFSPTVSVTVAPDGVGGT